MRGEKEAKRRRELTHSNAQNRRVVWYDGHKIIRDDQKLVVVDGKLEVRVDGCVDQSHSVGLSFFEVGSKPLSGSTRCSVRPVRVGAVDEAIVESGLGAGLREVPHGGGGLLIPVEQRDGA